MQRQRDSLLLSRLVAVAVLLLLLAAGCGHHKPVTPPSGDVTPPDPVRDLAVAARGDTVVLLSWTAPGDDSTTGRAAAYDIRYDDAPMSEQSFGSSWVVRNAPKPDTAGTRDSVLVDGLNYNTTYYFGLKTSDEASNISGLSNVVTFRTRTRPVKPDTTPPMAVADLRVSKSTTSTMTVAWTATGDDGTRGQAASYDLRYGTEPVTVATWDAANRVLGLPVPSISGSEESFTLAGLSANADYYFGLRVTDDAGNVSALSNSPMGKTKAYTGLRHVRIDGTGEYTSIQAAIDEAEDGDEILVGPGTYNENIDFLGKKIAVRSEMGAEATTIDGGGRDSSVVIFKSGETSDSVLEGFTITGGRGTRYGGGTVVRGGGTYALNSNPTILRNRITLNTAVPQGTSFPFGLGGGICLVPSNEGPPSLVSENIIDSNIAGADGGGIATANGNIRITNNRIALNSTVRGDGGGVWVESHKGGLVFSNNMLIENRAADHGGGFYEGSLVPGSHFVSIVSHNLFYKNRADGAEATGTSGGGIWLSHSSCWVAQNTFTANSGGGVGARGGNIAVEDAGEPYFDRNIIAFSPSGGGVACTGGSPTFTNNIVWQNTGGNGTGLCTDWYTTGGNMVVDPLLCHPDQPDASVAENSPALTDPVGIIGASTPGCPAIGTGPTVSPSIRTFPRAR